ncbi:MAG: glycosyltransferase family 2 protein [Rhodospirillaceae bacterium]|nr:glycosyltransferase family 2 protein [Rhodospirillaceae bacterium]MBT4750568.1 glycosyltransferase family 2 protein [Rhodospirillaceae bacterium]
MKFTVSITTCNRAESLARTLDAVGAQDYDAGDFEVIVADNGSTDHTKSVCDAAASQIADFTYIHDARPGQMVGWHLALAKASGDITCFIDDDVCPGLTWLGALADAFADQGVGLATGPIRLAFEAPPPDWLAFLTLGEPGGQTLPFLGLLDAGPAVRDIPNNMVWGSNFAVRRSVLLDVGGFHPCAMPASLIRFYGDGEVHVGRAAGALGYKARYHPDAGVDHHIPARRMSLDAVYAKFVTSGCARAFQTLRADGETFAVPTVEEIIGIAARYFRESADVPGDLVARVEKGLKDGMTAQLDSFENDAEFRKWVLMDNYLDIARCYTHPDLLSYHAGGAADWRSGNGALNARS